MTLFRSVARRPSRLSRLLAGFDLEVAMSRAQQQREEMPPRPREPAPVPLDGEPGAVPDTRPRPFTPRGPLNAEWDPCGKPHPPLKTRSDRERGAA